MLGLVLETCTRVLQILYKNLIVITCTQLHGKVKCIAHYRQNGKDHNMLDLAITFHWNLVVATGLMTVISCLYRRMLLLVNACFEDVLESCFTFHVSKSIVNMKCELYLYVHSQGRACQDRRR